MPGVITTVSKKIPGLTRQILLPTRDLTVAALPGIRSWRDVTYYDTARGVWPDRMASDGDMVNRHDGTPTIATLSGKPNWLSFADVVKLGRRTNATLKDFEPSEWTFACNYHPNNMASHDPIVSEPYDVTSDASNQFLRLYAMNNGSTWFFRLSVMGATENVTINNASGAHLFNKTDPRTIVVGYSAARGYTSRVAGATAVSTVPSPTSTQIVSRGQIQIGGVRASTGSDNMLTGALKNLIWCNVDLTATAYATALGNLETFLTSEQ